MRTNMRSKLLVRICPLFLCATCSGVFGQNKSISPGTVRTDFAVLVGFASGGQGATEGVLLIPGTVIPLATDGINATETGTPEIVTRSLSFTKSVARLWNTFRLDPARQIQKGLRADVRVGEAVSLPEIEGANLKMTATLVGFDNTSATFRVIFRQGEKSLADSTVIVTRGGRAVVGGTDGEAAPYIFVIVAPESPTQDQAGPLSADKNPGITQPVLTRKVDPVYPEEARKNKARGVVVLNIVVDTNGRVEDVQAIENPDEQLTKAAIEAVRQWEFSPALNAKRQPIKVLSTITIRFELK